MSATHWMGICHRGEGLHMKPQSLQCPNQGQYKHSPASGTGHSSVHGGSEGRQCPMPPDRRLHARDRGQAPLQGAQPSADPTHSCSPDLPHSHVIEKAVFQMLCMCGCPGPGSGGTGESRGGKGRLLSGLCTEACCLHVSGRSPRLLA